MKRLLPVMLILVMLSPLARGQERGAVRRAVGEYTEILQHISRLYLDSVDIDGLARRAAMALVSGLDPHSAYICAEDVAAMDESLEGGFEGIGIEFAIIGDTLTVRSVVEGGPASAAGIRASDRIVRVDTAWISGPGLTNARVSGLLRGRKGTKVLLTVLRRGTDGYIEFSVVRDRIPVNSVTASYLDGDSCLYIRLSRFAARSHREITDIISARRGSFSGIILDLRGNSGGYLPVATDIANEFLCKGDPIVYTEGLRVRSFEAEADGKGMCAGVPLVLLVDEASASASEILAGAIQDNDRGLVIGRRTFGKGLVQQDLPLSGGARLRLTVARYHTPSGRVIQAPYEMGDPESYYAGYAERFSIGEMFSRDSVRLSDSLAFKTLRCGRTVFGGGGIMPDVFVPEDTSAYTAFYREVLVRGLVTEYMAAAADRNRSGWLAACPCEDAFYRDFYISDNLFADFLSFAESRGIVPEPGQVSRSRSLLSVYMKALAASALYGHSAYFRVMNAADPAYIEALESLSSWQESLAASGISF